MGVYDDAQPDGPAATFQLRDLWRWRERFVDDHEKWRREVDKDLGEIEHLAKTVESLSKSFDGLRKTILGFAFTVAGSAIVFALSVLIATGRL